MNSNAENFDTISRLEFKYRIHQDQVSEIERDLRSYCTMDEHSALSLDGCYPVTSLYLDSPSRTFFRWKMEDLENRFELRIRTYGERPEEAPELQFEVKGRRGDIVIKHRTLWRGRDPQNLWITPSNQWPVTPLDRPRMENFLSKSLLHEALPLVLTQYRRRAWFGCLEDYARVTFDMEMRFREERHFDFSAPSPSMISTHLPDYLGAPGLVVLELKCERDRIPWWMVDLVKRHNLVRSSFSKYSAAVMELDRPLFAEPNLFVPPRFEGSLR